MSSVQLSASNRTLSYIMSTASCLGVSVDLISPLGQIKSNPSTAEDPGKQY